MFGKGKMEISIPKTHFLPGEMISGKVTLAVNKPVKANGVSVSLVGERTITRSDGTSRHERRTETQRLYDFKVDLDGEREYDRGGEYPFEIKIPTDILGAAGQPEQLEGALGQVIKVARALSSNSSAVRWFLEAKLDIPQSFDVGKKASISIG